MSDGASIVAASAIAAAAASESDLRLPLRLVKEDGVNARGRFLVAARDLNPDLLVLPPLRAHAFGVLDSHRKRVCAACAACAALPRDQQRLPLLVPTASTACKPPPSDQSVPGEDGDGQTEADRESSGPSGAAVTSSTANEEDAAATALPAARPATKSSLRCALCDQTYYCSQQCRDWDLDGGPGRHDLVCRSFRKLATTKLSAHEKSVVKAVLMVLLRRQHRGMSGSEEGNPHGGDGSNGVKSEACDFNEDGVAIETVGEGALAILIAELEIGTKDAGPPARGPQQPQQPQRRPTADPWQAVLRLQSHLTSWSAETRAEWRRAVRFTVAECRPLIDAVASDSDAEVGLGDHAASRSTVNYDPWTSFWCELLANEERVGGKEMRSGQDFELQCSHGRLSVDGNCRGVAEAEVEEGVMHLISKVESNGFGVWVIPPSNVAATDSRNEREHGGNGENGPGNVGVTKQESGKREKSVNAGRALFPLASYFNHSCEPTCEELTISYMDTNLPVQARRSQLSQDYYFLCRCVRCERELAQKPFERDKISFQRKGGSGGRQRGGKKAKGR